MVLISKNIPFIGEVFLEYHSSFKWKFYGEWITPRKLKEERVERVARIEKDIDDYIRAKRSRRKYDHGTGSMVTRNSSAPSRWDISIRDREEVTQDRELKCHTSLEPPLGVRLPKRSQDRAA